MRSTFKVLIVIVLMLAVFGQYTPASASEMYRWKGPGAEASFSNLDESGCVVTDVNLFTRDETFQNPPGQPSRGSFVYLTIYQYDYCADLALRVAEGWASIGEGDLQVAKKLGSATLSTVVTMYDWASDSYFDVSVDLSWSATAPTIQQSSSFRSHTPECKYHSRFRGSFRSADVNGTITDGSTNYTTGTGWGSIFDSRGTDSYIGCN
jgi:hypothetical protein